VSTRVARICDRVGFASGFAAEFPEDVSDRVVVCGLGRDRNLDSAPQRRIRPAFHTRRLGVQVTARPPYPHRIILALGRDSYGGTGKAVGLDEALDHEVCLATGGEGCGDEIGHSDLAFCERPNAQSGGSRQRPRAEEANGDLVQRRPAWKREIAHRNPKAGVVLCLSGGTP